MIFLTHFNLHAQYEKFINGEEMIMPNVTYCEDNDEVHYNSLKIIVKVSCVDASSGEELEGPHVSILDANKTIVEEWDSIAEPHTIEGLKPGGAYTLRANMTSEGYTTTTESSFSIDNTGEVTTTGNTTTDSDGNTILLVEIQMIQAPQVKASCTDIASGEELEGNHIQVLDSEGNVVDEWDSTTEAHEIEGLKTGEEYTLRNTVASDGYCITTDTTFSIDEHGKVTGTGKISEDGILLVEMEKTKVKVSSVDVADGAELAGSHIQVLDPEGNVVEEWDSTTEAHQIEGLKTGETYTLKTTIASEGYILATDTTFSIDEHGEVTTTGTISEEGIIMVEMQKTKVNISCTDIGNGEDLEGSTIQVIDSEGNVVEEWVSTTNAHAIEGLKTGEEYTLRNTVASEGYTLTTDTRFTINDGGRVTSTGTITEDGILLVELQKTIVKVSSVDVADGEEVGGSTIQLRDSEGNVVEEWTSTTEPHTIEGLKTGEEYTLRTTVPSDGYTVVTNNTTFTISDSGQVTSTGTTITDEYGNTILLVEMEMVSVEIKVSCVDIANGDEVAGNTIQVIGQDGSVLDEWTSTDIAHSIEGLNREATYTLHNTAASDGYVVATDTTFNIDNTGQITYSGETTEDENGNTVLLVEMQKTKVKVSCVDVANGKELEGSTIQVIDSEGNVVEEWVSTGEAHVIEGLKTGEEYTLRTTVAPDGYTLTTDTTFTIDEAGHVTGTAFVTTDENGNTVILIELAKTIVKISCVHIANGSEIEGVEMQIINPNAEVKDEWVSTNEPHQIEGLNINTPYNIHVMSMPANYALDTIDDVIFTINEVGRVTTTGTNTADGVILVELRRTH